MLQYFKVISVLLGTILLVHFIPRIHCRIAGEDRIVNFYLWDMKSDSKIIFTDDDLNSTQQTFFIIHGWSENSDVPIYEQMTKNLLIMDPAANVILVDYRDMSKYRYVHAFEIVDVAGKLIGKLIVDLIEYQGLNPLNTQIIGHSLGAHVSGRTGRYIINEIGQPIARIAAIDPAGPLFRFPTGTILLSNGLTRYDAIMVYATHTSYGMGTIEPFATVDFYFGFIGALQPACDLRTRLESFDELLFCNHRVARDYFTESILSCGFLATKVTINPFGRKRNIVYGQHVPSSAEGVYQVSANSEPPFARGSNTYPSCRRNIMD